MGRGKIEINRKSNSETSEKNWSNYEEDSDNTVSSFPIHRRRLSRCRCPPPPLAPGPLLVMGHKSRPLARKTKARSSSEITSRSSPVSPVPIPPPPTYGLLWSLWWFTILLLTMAPKLSATPVSILTINSPDGDIIDCVRRETQPTLSHPYFQNHKFQERPTDLPNVAKMEDQFSWQIWHRNGTRCPDGTIPLRRIHKIAGFEAGVEATEGHEYAVLSLNGTTSTPPPIYGTRATLSVMHPAVEGPHEFSLGQIWVVSGSYKKNNLNTMEAGWQTDAYTYTRCYNLRCPGFVQTSSNVLIEGAISTTSTFGAPQTELIIQIWKDIKLDLWWLGVGLNNGTIIVHVGYWPTEIFTRLDEYAEIVQWGGEIVNMNISGRHTTTQMGSGYLPYSPKAAYMRDLEVAITRGNFEPAHDLLVVVTDPNYYKVKMLSNKSFSYGGPMHGSAVYYRPTSIFFCFSLSLFLFF